MVNDSLKKRIVSRIKKVEGQVRGIAKMIENDKYCIEIFQQIAAVIGALKSINSEILENHLNTCVKETMIKGNEQQIRKKIRELKDIYKKY